jgi:hypothetical protein
MADFDAVRGIWKDNYLVGHILAKKLWWLKNIILYNLSLKKT